MKEKKLVFISEHYSPSTGATSQLVVDLVKELKAKGRSITVLTATPDLKYGRKNSSNVEVVRFNGGKASQKSILAKAYIGFKYLLYSLIWCLVNLRSCDQLVIFSNPPYAGALGLFAKFFKGSEYIFVFQDLFPRSAVLSGILPASGPITGVWLLLMSIICSNANWTITLTNAMKKRLKEELYFNAKVEVIENWAVEKAKPGNWRDNKFAKENDLGKKFTVQYSGNFGRLHDLMTLLEAARILRNEAIDFCFIGDGAKREQITNYRSAFNLANLTLLPYQPRKLLPLSLAACDMSVVALMPGAEDTVAPCKFYGILASGKALILIAQKSSELAKFVVQHKIGIVIDPGESDILAQELIRLSQNREEVLQMQYNSITTYESNFGLLLSASKYEKLFDWDPQCLT